MWKYSISKPFIQTYYLTAMRLLGLEREKQRRFSQDHILQRLPSQRGLKWGRNPVEVKPADHTKKSLFANKMTKFKMVICWALWRWFSGLVGRPLSSFELAELRSQRPLRWPSSQRSRLSRRAMVSNNRCGAPIAVSGMTAEPAWAAAGLTVSQRPLCWSGGGGQDDRYQPAAVRAAQQSRPFPEQHLTQHNPQAFAPLLKSEKKSFSGLHSA